VTGGPVTAPAGAVAGRCCPACGQPGVPRRAWTCEGCWPLLPADLRDAVESAYADGDLAGLVIALDRVLAWYRSAPPGSVGPDGRRVVRRHCGADGPHGAHGVLAGLGTVWFQCPGGPASARPAPVVERHSLRCDYGTSGECYCPAPGERAVKPGCGHLVDAGCGCDEL